MKKIILGVIAVVLSFCLTACGNATSNTQFTDLGNQLDETSNTIVEMQTVNPASIALGQNEKNEKLYASSQSTQQHSLDEQYYKAEILKKTAQLKDKLDGNIKLSKSQSSALGDLVLNLNKNTHLAKNTKGEMLSAEKSIKTLKKNPEKNSDNLSAKYSKLRCNSNIRMAYYENILNILDEIENCLNISNENPETNILSFETYESDKEENDEKQAPQKHHFKKNIDTYRPVEDESENRTDKTENLKTRNADTYGPMVRNIDTYNPYRYGNMPYGYGTMPYGAGYGMPYRNGFMRGYPGGMFGSNYYNRMATPQNQATPVETDNIETQNKSEEHEEKTESTAVSITQNIQKQHKLKNKKDDPIVVAF